MCMTLGGRVSEELFFGQITTGAQDDLQKITKIAFEICANYGMNERIGPVSYGGQKGQQEQFQKPFSEQTGQMLDAEVRKIITYVLPQAIIQMLDFSKFSYLYRDAHARTTKLLTDKKAEVEKIALLLLEKEVITRFVK